MSSSFHIDVDQVDMFAGYEWIDLGEVCDHDCPHNASSVVAWGPDVAHYELQECDLCGCRSWLDGRYWQERDRASGLGGFWWSNREWRHANPHPFLARA